MACRGSGVRISLAPFKFSIDTHCFQGQFRKDITFIPTCPSLLKLESNRKNIFQWLPLKSKQYSNMFVQFQKVPLKRRLERQFSKDHVDLVKIYDLMIFKVYLF